MTQQYTPNIGELCKEDARRDAIHFAVAPVVSRERVRPGQRVGLVDGEATVCVNPDKYIGIIDPFLEREFVEAGERCWLLLYPNTVTSLRHVWTHPAFVIRGPAPKEK